MQYTTHLAGEALAWIRGLLPYLKSMLSTMAHGQLVKCFLQEAVEQSWTCIWDPYKNCVVSTADTAITASCNNWDIEAEFAGPGTDTAKLEVDLLAIQKDSILVAEREIGRIVNNLYKADLGLTLKSQREELSKAVATSNQYTAPTGSTHSSAVSAESSMTEGRRGTAAHFKKSVTNSVTSSLSGSQPSRNLATSSRGSSKSGKRNISRGLAVIIERSNY
jgi:hypothetical protein